MSRLVRVLLINLAVLVVLAGAGAIAYSYWYQGYTYVSTANAQVEAPIATVLTPAGGILTGWHVYLGERVTRGQVLGTVTVADPAASSASASQTHGALTAAPAATQIPLKATTSGVIGQVDVANGSMVEPGLPLASVVETSQIYVIANLPETSIASVKIGQKATVSISAYPSQTFSGYVSRIGPATAGSFSLLPTANTTTDFTPVTQVIPVMIELTSTHGDVLRAGESASVQITVH